MGLEGSGVWGEEGLRENTRAVISPRTLSLGVGGSRINGSSGQHGTEDNGEEGFGEHFLRILCLRYLFRKISYTSRCRSSRNRSK